MSFTQSFLWARMEQITTRGMKFLNEMEQVIPRLELEKIIDEKITKAKTGRPRYATIRMLKVYFLQQRYNLSDPWVEDAIYDRVSFQKFLDMDIMKDKAPDETTILNFRRFLEDNELQKRMFLKINLILAQKWMLVKEWTTVDATILPAPSSTKNKEKKRDPEMKSTKKWKNYYFGMKTHVWTDSSNGLIHSVECTSANVHDLTPLEKLLHGKEKVIYGDSAYMSKENNDKYRKKGIAYYVCRRWSKHKKLDQLDK